jgi:hypothetical protein
MTADRPTFLARVAAAEPVAEIAAPGPAEDQEMPAGCEAFAAITGAVEDGRPGDAPLGAREQDVRVWRLGQVVGREHGQLDHGPLARQVQGRT